MKEHPLIPLIRCGGVHVDLVVRHTGDCDDLELVRLTENGVVEGRVELCDGLYTVHEREPDADMTILDRINRGELSGTHVFLAGHGKCQSSGFAHWHIELRGDTPAITP